MASPIRVNVPPGAATGVGFGPASFFREPDEQARQHVEYVNRARQGLLTGFAPARAFCKHGAFLVCIHARKHGGDDFYAPQNPFAWSAKDD